MSNFFWKCRLAPFYFKLILQISSCKPSFNKNFLIAGHRSTCSHLVLENWPFRTVTVFICGWELKDFVMKSVRLFWMILYICFERTTKQWRETVPFFLHLPQTVLIHFPSPNTHVYIHTYTFIYIWYVCVCVWFCMPAAILARKRVFQTRSNHSSDKRRRTTFFGDNRNKIVIMDVCFFLKLL